MMHNRRILLK